MLFRRREPAKWKEKLRVWIWPRRSWVRSGKYVTKRVLRLTASPHAVAAGVAAGVFTSFTPFMGFHFLIAALVAYIIGGNMIASALGTFFGNPISFPVIWASTFTSGNYILHGSAGSVNAAGNAIDPKSALTSFADLHLFETGFSGLWQALADIWTPIILPMAIGGIPLGISLGIGAYLLTLWGAKVFRKTRTKLINEKAEANRLAREHSRERTNEASEITTDVNTDDQALHEKGRIGKARDKARETASALKERSKEKIADKYAASIHRQPNTIIGE